MYKTSFAALALLGAVDASCSADENWDNTIASCQDYARKFLNTCMDAGNLASMTSATVSCQNVGVCAGTESGSTCSWERKLCVTCRNHEGVVKIRVQTNGLPSHCYASPGTAPASLIMDYEVDWMSTAVDNPYSQAQDQGALNALLCDDLTSAKSDYIPSSAGYVKQNGQSFGTAWGVATTGVLMFTAMSAENVDPFYPAVYGDVTDPDSVVEKVDWCLAHPQVQGVFHYHSASICQANSNYQTYTGAMDQDLKTIMAEGWSQCPYRSALAISKDGRPILTPYYAGGQAYSDCEVDICNGLDINGHYQYATTFFHPYIMGCYGKGSAPALYQQCSTNPRLCGIEYVPNGAAYKTISFVLATATMLAMTLY